VAKPDQRRTEILRLRNVRFFRGVEQLSHDHRVLEFADCVALTFEKTEEGRKNGHGDSNGLTRRSTMPGEGSGSNCEEK